MTESSPSSPPLTAEEKLKKLEEKTQAWKEAVATQLHDAAHKNKTLREELRAMTEEKDKALADLRVQLTAEFKDRTAAMKKEANKLQQEIRALKEEQHQLQLEHAAELKTAVEHATSVEAVESAQRHQEQLDQLHQQLASLQKELLHKEHDGEGMKKEIELLRLQLPPEEKANDTDITDLEDNNDKEEEGEAISAEALRAEQEAKAQLQLELEQERRGVQELQYELQRQQEHSNMVQSLLRQSQSTISELQQRIATSQDGRHEMEKQYAGRVSTLSKELALSLEKVQQLEAQERECRSALSQARQEIADLTEEAESRETALQTLLMTEGEKKIVQQLQVELDEMTDEVELWRTMCFELEQQQKGQSPRSVEHTPLPSNAAGSLLVTPGRTPQRDPPTGLEREAEFNERERALVEKEKQIEVENQEIRRKQNLLTAVESRLQETRRQLAEQANQLTQQQKALAAAAPPTTHPHSSVTVHDSVGESHSSGLYPAARRRGFNGVRLLLSKPRLLIPMVALILLFIFLMLRTDTAPPSQSTFEK